MRLIVLRHAADISEDQRTAYYEGRWVEIDPMRIYWPGVDTFTPHAVAEPTGRYEVREDGVRAEVWEIRLTQPDAP